MMSIVSRSARVGSLAACLSWTLAGCSDTSSAGQGETGIDSGDGAATTGEPIACDEFTPCTERGQTCDLMRATCVRESSLDATADPGPETFVDLAVPFFRGKVCVPHEVKSGASIPVTLSPCLHPCISVTDFEFKHFLSCVENACSAYATMWVIADAVDEGCPSDAFGRFEPSLCTNETQVELSIGTTLDSGPISGSMLLEIPFLSNEDVREIVAAPTDQQLLESKIFQYPQDSGRIPDGRAIELNPDHDAPPDACDGDSNCECYDVGF